MGSRVAQLNKWFNTPLGKRLLSEETDALQQILPDLFGYHLLQIGSMGTDHHLESSRIMHRCILNQSVQLTDNSYSNIYALANALPFAQDSLDVVILPHILEFEDRPHEVLREVERILIPEGHVIILGFNPFSLWGILRWFMARRHAAPWCGRFLPLLRLKDWLTLLSFELKKQQTLFFALPFHNDRFKNYTKLLEKIGSRWTGNFGAVYILIARKRSATLTPIKSRWQLQQPLVPNAIGTHFEEN